MAHDEDDRAWERLRLAPLYWLAIFLGLVALVVAACAAAAVVSGGDAALDGWSTYEEIGRFFTPSMPALGVALGVSATVVLSVSALTGFGSAQSRLAPGLLSQLEAILLTLMIGLTLATVFAASVPFSDPAHWPEFLIDAFIVMILVQAAFLSTRARREDPEVRVQRLASELRHGEKRAARVFGPEWRLDGSRARLRPTTRVILITFGIQAVAMTLGIAVASGWVFAWDGTTILLAVFTYSPIAFAVVVRFLRSDQSVVSRSMTYYSSLFGVVGILLEAAFVWALIDAGPGLTPILLGYTVSSVWSFLALFTPIPGLGRSLRSLDMASTARALESRKVELDLPREYLPTPPRARESPWRFLKVFDQSD